jgi:hypothetical protein
MRIIESFHVVGFADSLCLEPKVRELEANYQEAIEVLKELTIEAINHSWNEAILKHYVAPNTYALRQNIEYVTIIEKAYGKSWEEIKE